ncbi:MAG TPA: hypothetical protein VKV15_14200 [Bryobacteraceae bacterium]|nr:hypothetical protein [Bryobacteraceae bacterium]
MSESPETSGKRDYSCELIGLAALFILSALSHFWYIAIFAGLGMAAWAFIRLIGVASQIIQASAGERIRARETNS